jgi:hypothetical protein
MADGGRRMADGGKAKGVRRLPHAIVDAAVRAALFVKDEPAPDERSRQALFAMYHAQCTATDQLAKQAAKRGPRELNERIKELEGQLARANSRIVELNEHLDTIRLVAKV